MSTVQHLPGLPPVCKALHAAKAASKLSFEQLATQLGRDEVFVAAIFYGQAVPTDEDLKKLVDALGDNLPESASLGKDEATMGDGFVPVRGNLWQSPPTDPVLYRLYEILVVYGYPFKHLIYEKFGDGIMSAIDFKAHVEKKEDPKGDRVVITLDGKFLPYKKF